MHFPPLENVYLYCEKLILFTDYTRSELQLFQYIFNYSTAFSIAAFSFLLPYVGIQA